MSARTTSSRQSGDTRILAFPQGGGTIVIPGTARIRRIEVQAGANPTTVDFIIGVGQPLQGTNAVQTITPPGSGNFTITVQATPLGAGGTTGALAFNASLATVAAALAAIPAIGSTANIAMSGTAGTSDVVTFVGALAAQPISAMTVSAGTIAQTTTGVVPTGASILSKSVQSAGSNGLVAANTVVAFEYGGRQDCLLPKGSLLLITSTDNQALISVDTFRA